MGKKKQKAEHAFPNADPNNLITMIESRHRKLCEALDAIDDRVPDNAMDGTSKDLREALSQVNSVVVNLAELIAYRKLLGVD